MVVATHAFNILSCLHSLSPSTSDNRRFSCHESWGNSFLLHGKSNFFSCKLNFVPALAVMNNVEDREVTEIEKDKPRYRWLEVGPSITEAQKQTISQLPPNMTKRCQAFMKQIICYDPWKGTFLDLLAVWVRYMKPRRADWLVVLKELNRLEHPRYFEVAEWALQEESFEANIRDYTKLIHGYGKQGRVQDAESVLLTMKRRGFICDQVTLTAMIDIYSKAGNLKLAEETFEEMKLVGQPFDKRCYGSMIMAYIRARMPEQGEVLLREMDAQQIYAGSEVYKALLRAYSLIGNAEGAQRVFDAIQFASIPPDVKLCGLLINAYQMAGQSQKAYAAFQNMRRAGLEPNDKCLALVLSAYEKENNLGRALDFLMDLESSRIIVGKESSQVLARWFGRLGVVKEVEFVLRDYAMGKNFC
ncbi:putative Tetratricopeptide repeat (TPR)-like superfamily protein [Tripterygium wilfordii]|uniref:Putative Tetratricopeptide repeat (TPR)-like superfamily protein n=1 Tax=Tripterygium wilfordii TaxID=458696 RepID=A0A7J7DDC2_TRIWF|nr:pentatricopeptide repeat-containing protein At1g01970-like [Tripterygium wilfordii]KAF5744323.1 putative Tetratricopeptide repeat (TPR)-like superfamily protein [Tripterygium wilfordii]